MIVAALLMSVGLVLLLGGVVLLLNHERSERSKTERVNRCQKPGGHI